MLKDITIGQYFPGDSVIHRMDPRFKLVLTIIFIIMLFLGKQIWCLIPGTLLCLIALKLSHIPFKLFWKSMKPLVPILLITAVLDLFLIDSGTTLFHWHFIEITTGAIRTAVMMIIRIFVLLIGSSLLTYTTSPIALTDAIERLLGPLKKIHVPVHVFAMMMTIALRFIPTLLEETDKIMTAQKARGADFTQGNMLQRAKSLVPVIVPLFVSAFRRAEELATAMECRCYRGDVGRTKLRQLTASSADYMALFLTLFFLGLAILLKVAF